MKDHKKFITFLILLAMFVLVSVPTFAANDLGVEYSAVLDQPIISVSDEAQTIVMTVKTNNPVDLDSITAQVILPEGFSVTAITNDTLGFVKGDSNLNNGMIAWSYGYDEADYLTTDVLAVVTITVPAGTSAGSYVIAFDIMDITSDWGTTWEDGTTVSTTLTIKDVPACEHEYENGCSTICIHCGEERPAPAHNVIHVVAKDATCTENGNIEYWYCEICRSAWADEGLTQVTNLKSVILPAGHSFLEGKRGDLLSAGDCVTPATYATKCDRCDVEDETKVITGELGDHTLVHVEAKEVDCFNDGNLEYWYCSECEQYWIDAELTENTNKDAVILPTTGHFETAADNGNGTHRIECCVCSTVLADNIPHDFTSGKADNTCICDKTYCEHGKLVYEANQDLGHFVKCELCGDEIRYESHVGEYHIVHIDLGQIAIAIDCKDCGYNVVPVWYSDPEVSTQPGTCLSPAVTTYVFNIEDLPLYAKGENLGDVVYAPEKNGETDLIYRVNEDNWTVVITVIGELDGNNHVSSEVSYQDITDEQHTVYHPCCKATETVDHTFDETTHMCVCGKVETFTLTIRVLALDGKGVELTVPYGANLLEVLAKAAEEGLIPALGDAVPVNDGLCIGINIPTRYSYFDADEQDWIHISENDTMPASDYDIDQDIIFTGWGRPDTDQPWGYQVEGIQIEGWYKVDGAWYFFFMDEETGWSCRTEGLSRVPYPTAPINGILYAPNAEDLAYAANKGREFIDATEAWFVFGEDGKFQFDMTEIMDGKYVENGMIAWHPGFVTVGGELYYFVGDKTNGGNIWANGDVIVSRLNGAEGFVNNGTYNFVDGRLNKQNGIFPSANGKQLYYYINGHKQVKLGLTKLGEGKYIYVRSNGELAVGEYYIPANGLGVVSTLYTFDANGYMVNPKYTNVNGIVDGYYYVNGKIDYGAGLINIDGDIYYVRSSGKVATGEYYITNTNGMPGFQKGMKLTFGADGKLLTKTTDFGSVINGYYYVGGKIAYGAGVVKMEDENGVFYIYVKSNGQLATGKYWPTTLNGELAAGEYDWGTDGKYYPGN